jgi:hypothetical protein
METITVTVHVYYCEMTGIFATTSAMPGYQWLASHEVAFPVPQINKDAA